MILSANMSAPQPVRNDDALRPWSLPERIGFRFAFCYMALVCIAMVDVLKLFFVIFAFHGEPNGIPGMLDPFWNRAVPWTAVHLMHLRAPKLMADGDTLYGYVLLACRILLAAGATLVWSWLDRRRTQYRVLLAWLRRAVSFLLACVLFTYGIDKVFPMQFGRLSLVRLSERVGDLDLFNLLWTFMAGSTAYTIFSGATEILAGLFLLIPRFETMGALLSIGVMTNVVVLNLTYDVPVKLFASHLLLCALFLAACNWRRIVGVLLSYRAIGACPSVPLSCHRWVNQAAATLQPAAGLVVLMLLSVTMFHNYEARQARSSPSPLFGIWVVDEFRLTGTVSGPLLTPKVASDLHVGPGEDRWQQLIIDSAQESAVRLGNGLLDSITVNVDAAGKTATFTDPGDPAWRCDLRVERPGEGLLNLDGRINGVAAALRLHRTARDELRLLISHSHWVLPGGD